MAEIDWERLERFLSPPLIAVVVTVGRDGMPHPTPVWYGYAAGRLTISTTRRTVKVRNLRRDPRLAVCVYDDSQGTHYVSLTGRAEVMEGEGIWGDTRAIVARYVEGAERVKRMIERMRGQGRVVVRMAVEEAWWRG